MLLEKRIHTTAIRHGQAVPKELSFLSLLLTVRALIKKEWNSALGSSSLVFSSNFSANLVMGTSWTMCLKVGGILLITALFEMHINSLGPKVSYKQLGTSVII